MLYLCDAEEAQSNDLLPLGYTSLAILVLTLLYSISLLVRRRGPLHGMLLIGPLLCVVFIVVVLLVVVPASSSSTYAPSVNAGTPTQVAALLDPIMIALQMSLLFELTMTLHQSRSVNFCFCINLEENKSGASAPPVSRGAEVAAALSPAPLGPPSPAPLGTPSRGAATASVSVPASARAGPASMSQVARRLLYVRLFVYLLIVFVAVFSISLAALMIARLRTLPAEVTAGLRVCWKSGLPSSDDPTYYVLGSKEWAVGVAVVLPPLTLSVMAIYFGGLFHRYGAYYSFSIRASFFNPWAALLVLALLLFASIWVRTPGVQLIAYVLLAACNVHLCKLCMDEMECFANLSDYLHHAEEGSGVSGGPGDEDGPVDFRRQPLQNRFKERGRSRNSYQDGSDPAPDNKHCSTPAALSSMPAAAASKAVADGLGQSLDTSRKDKPWTRSTSVPLAVYRHTRTASPAWVEPPLPPPPPATAVQHVPDHQGYANLTVTATSEPATSEPATSEPAASEPATSEPVTATSPPSTVASTDETAGASGGHHADSGSASGPKQYLRGSSLSSDGSSCRRLGDGQSSSQVAVL
jgi:hypothetical protein